MPKRMPHLLLTTEAGRREALRYAASPEPGRDVEGKERTKRIRQLVAEASAAAEEGDWRQCLLLAECLNADCPTSRERDKTAAEVRERWKDDDALIITTRGQPPGKSDHCLYCGKTFRNTVALILHVRDRH